MQAGFTLIEVLAAFVVFALAFGAVMHALSGSLYNTVRAGAYTEAALLARSKMAAIGITDELKPRSAQGEFDNGYRWQLDIHELEKEIAATVAGDPLKPAATSQPGLSTNPQQLGLTPQVALYEIELTITWGEDAHARQVVFRTLRAVHPEL